MQSREWAIFKARYWSSKLSKDCYICKKKNLGKLELHHKTYDRFGEERLTDVVPVHRSCHKKIHNYHRKHRNLTITEATLKVKELTRGK